MLPNHKLYNPNNENERECYFYSLLLLFVPFLNEQNLLQAGESAEQAFQRHMEENVALNTHSEKLLRMLEARNTVQKINEARQTEQEAMQQLQPLEEDERPQVVGEARSAMNDVFDLQHNDDTTSFEDLVSSLNTDQTRIFKHVQSHLQHQGCHETGNCKCNDFRPLHMFVSGVGGTGKSFLIKTIRALVYKMWPNNSQSLWLLQQGLQHSMLVVSPSTDCCSSPLSMREGQLVTGNWEKMH